MHEAQGYRDNCFLTLTYSDEQLSYGYAQATLVKRDLQLFWKRLRKELGHGIRYFACGEYGEQRLRPHYHACLFGVDFEDKTLLSVEGGNNLYHSDLLDRVWSHGHCSIGALTPGSAAYVARYILDKNLGREAQWYEERGVEPEYVVMSRRPGIGSKWIAKYTGDVYPADRVVSEGGQMSRPPRYYDQFFADKNPQEMQKIKIRRLLNAEERFDLDEMGAKRALSRIRFYESRVKNIQKKLH